MQLLSFLKYVVAAGALVLASPLNAAPNAGTSKLSPADEEKIQQGFQLFRNALMISMKRIVVIPDDGYDITIPVIIRRDDFGDARPMQVEYGGTIVMEGKVPIDQYGIHLSSVFLKTASPQYIQFTGAQAICIMVLGIAKEASMPLEHARLMRKCACAAIGKSACTQALTYVLARVGSNAPEDEALERIINEYDIQNFVWP